MTPSGGGLGAQDPGGRPAKAPAAAGGGRGRAARQGGTSAPEPAPGEPGAAGDERHCVGPEKAHLSFEMLLSFRHLKAAVFQTSSAEAAMRAAAAAVEEQEVAAVQLQAAVRGKRARVWMRQAGGALGPRRINTPASRFCLFCLLV